jgi:ketosteroid isomerase-like protein
METQVLDPPAARLAAAEAARLAAAEAAPLAPADVVRSAYAAYNRGELDEDRLHLSPDLEWILPPTALHGQILRGPEELLRMLESELEAFSRIRREPLELEERGDRVVGTVAVSMRGRVSGIELEQRGRFAFTVRNGLIVRAEALAA